MQTAESIIRDCLGKSRSFSAPFLSSPIIEIFLFIKVDLILRISSVDLQYLHVSPCFPWLINHSQCLSNWSSACCAPATCCRGPRLSVPTAAVELRGGTLGRSPVVCRTCPSAARPTTPHVSAGALPCQAACHAAGVFATEQKAFLKFQIKHLSSSLVSVWCLPYPGTRIHARPLLCLQPSTQ